LVGLEDALHLKGFLVLLKHLSEFMNAPGNFTIPKIKLEFVQSFVRHAKVAVAILFTEVTSTWVASVF